MFDDNAAHPGGGEAPLAEAELYERLKGWFLEDRRAQSEWYRDAEADFAFHAGHGQWDEADRQRLKGQNRPCVTFNRIAPAVAAVIGMEVANRQEVRFIPRTTSNRTMPAIDPVTGQSTPQPVPGADDQGPAELYTGAAMYLRDQCNAEDEESDAFQDAAICGMGWTETRVDYDEDPAGRIVIDRIDPLEMVWDARAVKRNLVDSRRMHRAREIDIGAARQMFPGFDDDELDAGWARLGSLESPLHDREAARNYGGAQAAGDARRGTVTIVECEWSEMKVSYRVADPASGGITEAADEDALATLQERAKSAGVTLVVQQQKKRILRHAFLGGTLLESGAAQAQASFKFKAITGYRDRNRRQWVGLVRAMRDPQRWANALFSSVLNSIQTSGKGIMAERGAFDNDQQAETDWANAGRIVWLKTGALSGAGPRVTPKPPALMPTGVEALMQFALQSLRDVSGINVEMLGLADRGQAASLEYQRRQAGTTILAPFFDGLRRYRKDQGRLLLHLIRDYLSDGRLVRIAGPDFERYVPLIRRDDVLEFDIIVDDAPASPNQKEASWAILQQMLPLLMKQPLPIEAWGRLLKASPLPGSLVAEFVESVTQDQQRQMEQSRQLQEMQAQAMQPPAMPAPVQARLQADLQKLEAEVALKQQELQLRRYEADLNAALGLREIEERQAARLHRAVPLSGGFA
ncbi:MAG TPA: phage portal protein [Alphaproteobacteria bacterium]|nr:phage portal protein [Alphaproteobacteria bacterium]